MTQSQRQLDIAMDRDAIRQALAAVAATRTQSDRDWCFACGAGSAAARDVVRGDWIQASLKETLQGKSLPEFLSEIDKLQLTRDWCFACGAGKGRSPLEQIGDPAELPDAVIDQLASQLITAIKVG